MTGASGFAGARLAALLAADGHDVTGTVHGAAEGGPELDVRDAGPVDALVRAHRPERVYHLAAQSSAARSWRDPDLTYAVNVTGTHHVLDAVRRHAPDCRVLVAGTSDAYGTVTPEECPVVERSPLRPLSPYAASKVAAEWVAHTFHHAFGLQVVVSRAFMHIGPGQPPSFATADWALQIARIEAGLAPPTVTVGDLSLERELGDVRDVVRAYCDALEAGEPGEVYNVATGEPWRLEAALGFLTGLAGLELEVRIDESKMRPADPRVLTGSAAKLEALTGWKPAFRPEDTLAEVLDFWRARVRDGLR